MAHKYSLSITDPWNAGETEDFESDSPFQALAVGDEFDTSGFASKVPEGGHRTPCRVTRVTRNVSQRTDTLWDITVVHLEVIDEN